MVEGTDQSVVVPASASLISQGFSSRVVMPECNGIGLPLVIGEAPGKSEDDTGIPFHPEAEAGGLFKRLMSRVGVERTSFNIANVVMQRPPYNELYDAKGYPMAYTHEAIEYWKPFLHATIEELQPPVIIGLGRTALETLTGFTDIGTTRGYVNEARIDIERMEGDPLADDWNHMWDRKSLHIPTVCTYHPAFLNYGQRHLSGVFIRDVLAALEIAESGWEAPSLKVTPSPSPEAFRAFCEGFQPEFHALTADIETPDTRGEDESTLEDAGKQTPIDRMSFCYATEIGGFSVPFEEPFLAMAKGLIARAKVLRGWNWRLFDWPRLTQHGFTTQAREEDLIDCWRHLHRTLPASVAFVAPFYVSMPPWKHEAHSQPEYYSAMDAIVTHLIGEGMEREMRASGQWETYQRHVVEIISTNHGVCTQMAKNGLPIDPEKIVEFQKELELKHKERLARLQELVPEALKPVKQKNGLKRPPRPKGEKLFIEQWACAQGYVKREFHLPASELSHEEANAYCDEHDIAISPESIVAVTIKRWAKLEEFNPASHLQVKALIRHYGHKAKTDRKTKNETSSDDTLKSLVTKYVESKKASDVDAVECYKLIRECRAIDKVLGTYVKGWKPASDGLIHATPGIWGDMFRISWRKPNLAATVADKKEIQIAAGFRKCICVPDESVIIESDWKGMESVIVAYLANDPDYMRLARFGPHAYLASHVIGRPADLTWSDEDLSAYLSAIKHDPRNTKVYDDSKHCIHGISYGMSSFLMAELYEMTRTKAQWYIDMFFSLFPRVKRWQQATMQKAHDECKLVNAWGYRMPFWNVFAWQQKRYDRLRQLWVRCHTEKTYHVLPKREQEWVDNITAKIARDDGTPLDVRENAAISSLCYDLGDEAKSAISFLPRDIGAAMLKDTLLKLNSLAKAGALRTCTHDSILAITSRKNVDEVAWQKRQAMEAPQPLLGGLVIEVDQVVGQSWDKKAMSKWEAACVVSA